MKKTIWAITLVGTVGCGMEGPAGPKGEAGIGEQGPKGDPGETPANLAAIQPTTAYLGRRVMVQIGGNNTHFAQGTKVDFGDPNVRVEKVTVGGPTLLTAQVLIGPTADGKMGFAKAQPHDVTITSDYEGKDEVVTLKGQFNVSSPLRFVTLDAAGMPGGKLVQGGIGRFVVTNLDYVQNPFSATSSPNFGMSFLDDGAGSPLQGNTSQVQARAFINVKAAEDPLFLVQSASPLGELVIYPLPAGVSGVSPKIEKRTPADLALGMAKSDKIPAAGDTMLYKITPSMELGMKDRVYSLAFTLPMGAKTRPVVSLLPESGKWTEQLPAGGGAALDNTYFTVAAKDAKEMYGVVFDAQLAGGEGYDFGVTVKEKEANFVAMYMAGTKNDMPNKQVDLAKATFIKDSKLATHTEKNYFEFTAPKDQKIYVVTAANDPTKDETDTTIDILEGTCKAGMSITGGPVDDDYFESVAFDATMGKTYCIVVADSTFPFYAQLGGPYTLLVTTND